MLQYSGDAKGMGMIAHHRNKLPATATMLSASRAGHRWLPGATQLHYNKTEDAREWCHRCNAMNGTSPIAMANPTLFPGAMGKV